MTETDELISVQGDGLQEEKTSLRKYRRDPILWIKDHVAITLAKYRGAKEIDIFLDDEAGDRHTWLRRNRQNIKFDERYSYQEEALRRMAEPGQFAYQWANGCAKTATAALWMLWFMDVYPGAKCITTAGTWSQLKEQLWREIAYWAKRSQNTVIQDVGPTSVNVDKDWFAFGRAASKEETFEGVHGQYVAVVMDESKAIKPEIFSAVRRTLRGNPGGKFWWICLSSPGSPTGPFYDITNGDRATRWNVSRMSAYQSSRVSLEQINDDIDDLGEESPLFVTMDLGEFPDESEDTIIPLSWAQSAVNRNIEGDGLRTLGVDVARFGNDETVFIEVDGGKVKVLKTYTGRDLMKTTGQTLSYSPGMWKVGIDDSGIGGGVVDRLREQEVKGIVALNGGGAPKDETRFANLNTEMMWSLREALRVSYEDDANLISLPDDKVLLHQLTSRKYGMTSNGKLMIEPKSKMKERGEKSPDRADTLMYAWWVRQHSKMNHSQLFARVHASGVDSKSPGAVVRAMKF